MIASRLTLIPTPAMGEPTLYTASRKIGGGLYVCRFYARGWDDASEFCNAAGLALDGELKATIPVEDCPDPATLCDQLSGTEWIELDGGLGHEA